MAFEKAFENNYHDLPLHTKYRFAEIEIGLAINQLTPLMYGALSPRERSIAVIFDAIVPKAMDYDEEYNRFQQSMNTTYVNAPPTNERIHYLIAHGQSYKKIRDLTSASFNTIAKERYQTPEFQPIYPRWTEEMLLRWNKLSPIINLWNEELAHQK